MGRIRTFYFADAGLFGRLVSMNTDRDRVISIVLSESEWQAFTARHPQPVNWLRDRILTELQAAQTPDLQEAPVRPAAPQARIEA
jgi:hypothetical protein